MEFLNKIMFNLMSQQGQENWRKRKLAEMFPIPPPTSSFRDKDTGALPQGFGGGYNDTLPLTLRNRIYMQQPMNSFLHNSDVPRPSEISGLKTNNPRKELANMFGLKEEDITDGMIDKFTLKNVQDVQNAWKRDNIKRLQDLYGSST